MDSQVKSKNLFGLGSDFDEVAKRFEKFKELYLNGPESEERAFERLCFIKWGKPVPTCPNCKRALSKIKRKKRRRLTYKCYKCPQYPEFSFFRDTPLRNRHWLPKHLLVAAFYMANAEKVHITTLSQEAQSYRVAARELNKIWSKVKKEKKVDLKAIGNNNGFNKYSRRAFALLKFILRHE